MSARDTSVAKWIFSLGLVVFYGISNAVSHLIENPIYTYILYI